MALAPSKGCDDGIAVTPGSDASGEIPDDDDDDDIESILASFRTKRNASTIVIFDSDGESTAEVVRLAPRPGVPPGATNKWMRRHAFQSPMDPLFVRHWLFFLTMAGGMATTVPRTWAVQWVGFPLLVACAALDIWISVVDTMDPRVRSAASQRDMTFVMFPDCPVICPET
ncbi:hypothetical protein EV182_008264, partial [Spiromyces aspiralis]